MRSKLALLIKARCLEDKPISTGIDENDAFSNGSLQHRPGRANPILSTPDGFPVVLAGESPMSSVGTEGIVSEEVCTARYR
jgi:hypothetical protein